MIKENVVLNKNTETLEISWVNSLWLRSLPSLPIIPLLLLAPLPFFPFCSCFFILFWLCPVACGILVPQLGVKPTPLAVKAVSPHHRTAGEFPLLPFLVMFIFVENACQTVLCENNQVTTSTLEIIKTFILFIKWEFSN